MAGMARRVAARLGEARKGKEGLGWQGEAGHGRDWLVGVWQG